MSHHYKPDRASSSQTTLFDMLPVDVHPKERERVAQLIAVHKSGPALDVAKDVHRRCHSTASEALLLEAYGARFLSLVERNLDREATALMDLVRERYPSARERLLGWNAVFAARRGDLSALLEPLNDSSLAVETQAAIAASVRRDTVDLGALAECPTLAPQHPLRTAAAALSQAFAAVTSGPVADEALALPEVSRSSPLAPWKMLVRAIAAFYRRDDALCEKCLAAIEQDSAAARLAPALRSILHAEVQQQTLSPATAALLSQAGGGHDQLRALLKRLDLALDRRNQPLILQEASHAVSLCRQAAPDLLERLKQHITVRGLMAGAKLEKVSAALGGHPLPNAYFWRLMARGIEENKSTPMAIPAACSYWEEFRKHAVREGWFPAQGPEAATLYLHMADQLRHLDAESLGEVRSDFARFDNHADHYRGQPPELRSLMPSQGHGTPYFLSPHTVLERACQAHPCAENFQRWLHQAAEADSPATADLVAERWCAALPNDIPPLLHLMQSAEKRNALQKAFKFMERAEAIDGLNAEVRRARLRLLVSMAVRHLREKKPKLAEKELREIDALPQAKQGDRPAFVAALRFVWCLLRDAKQEAASAQAEAVRLLGDGAVAQFLLLEVERWCGRQSSALGDAVPPTTTFSAAFGRVCALGEDMGMPVDLIEGMPEQLMKELSAPNVSAHPRALEALGEAAMRQDHYPLAYTIAGAGLAQGAESQARFLFLRARSLPPWEDERRTSCLAAASELARRRHDSDLLRRISEWRDDESSCFDLPEPARAGLGTEEIARVVQREIKERALPAPASRPKVEEDDEDCQCPACQAERGELPRELIEMVDQLGPETVAQALAEMLGIGGKKKRRRRRSILDDLDTPF